MLRRFLLTALLLVMPTATLQAAGFGSKDPRLPDCSVVLNSAVDNEEPPDMVLLSTLDGKVSAVDSLGRIIWQVETGPALLSTQPKTLFLENSRGETTTCIPSLDGSLYLFDGKNVQLFVTAELLLRNSLKTGQTVLSGGTEIKTFGLDPRTGEVRYICSADGGCKNLTGSDGKVGTPGSANADDVVVIRRHTQTVRAIEPRNGEEKWHFSVAENELQYVPETSSCGRKPLHELHPPEERDRVRIVASKGILVSSKRDSNEINWELQLSAPVASAWKLHDSHLQKIDLFEPSNIYGMEENGPKPFLHLAQYQQQLYMHHDRKSSSQEPPAIDAYVRLMVEHKMIQTPQNALAPISEGPSTELIPQMLQTLRSNEEYDTGIYFVQDETDEACTPPLLLPAPETTEQISGIDPVSENVSAEDSLPKLVENSDDDNIIYVVYSIWHYWKEISVISIAVSVAMNLFMPRLLAMLGIKAPAIAPPCTPTTPQPSEVTTLTAGTSSSKTITDSTHEMQTHKEDADLPEPKKKDADFESRFVTDFVPVRCLGKGGFGIVFETKNKIDDCSYAIKRIRLPAKKAAREKVLREVKALAKLDHLHIVRYYNAWLETPPPGWQEALDETYKTSLPLSSTEVFTNEVGSAATAATESSAFAANPLGINDFNPLRLRKDNFNPLKFSEDDFNPLKLSEDDSNPLKLPEDNLMDLTAANGDTSLSENYGGADGSACVSNEEESDNEEKKELCDISSDQEQSVVFQSPSGDHSRVQKSNFRPAPARVSSNTKDWISRAEDIKALNKRERPSCLPIEESSPSQPVYLYIQMQLCRKESLKEWLSHRATLDIRGHDKVLDIFFQISSAVEYVHERGLIHRDLKPSNIFFSLPDDVVKVGDFGLVTGTDSSPTSDYTPNGTNRDPELSFDGNFSDVQLTDKVGTQLYMSPEQIRGNKYNQKVDIFSLGLIFFELLWSLPTQMERVRTLSAIRDLRFPKGFKKGFPTEYQLVRRMVASDPINRPSALEVRKNSLFTEIQEELLPVVRRRTISARTSLGSQDSGA